MAETGDRTGLGDDGHAGKIRVNSTIFQIFSIFLGHLHPHRTVVLGDVYWQYKRRISLVRMDV